MFACAVMKRCNVRSTRPKPERENMSLSFVFISFFLSDLHSTGDVDRLGLRTVAGLLQVDDGSQQVGAEAPLTEVLLAEHFNVRGQEVLTKKATQTTSLKKRNRCIRWKRTPTRSLQVSVSDDTYCDYRPSSDAPQSLQ